MYKEPLKKCQVEGCLLTIEPDLLFGNLEELCQVWCFRSINIFIHYCTQLNYLQISHGFSKELYNMLMKSRENGVYASTDLIVSLFDKVPLEEH